MPRGASRLLPALSCSWLAHLDHALAGDSALFIYLFICLFVYLFFVCLVSQFSLAVFSGLLLSWSVWRAELWMESLQLFSYEMMCSLS